MANTKPKLTKRDQQRIETRQRVFDAAIAEFVRVGVDKAQVEAIVKNAEVSIGTYYRYFPTKDAVLFELLMQYVTDIAQLISANTQGKEMSLQQLLAATIDPLFDFYEQNNKVLIREIFSVVVKQPPQDFDWVSIPLLAPIIARFEQEYQQGKIIYADPAQPTRLFFTSILGFLTSMNPIRHRQEAHEFIAVFLRGIQK
jgi:AcrR family transcriptional regulator